jgi:uncharacterized protein (DUF362 family)/ferredoxin
MSIDKRVCIVGCPDYETTNVRRAVRRALEAFGGAGAILPNGGRVLLKVNLLSAHKPEKAVTTHPEVVAALAREVVEAGGEVTIADSPAGPYTAAALRRIYAVCGMDKAAGESGARLNYDTSYRQVAFPEGRYSRSFNIITPVLEADLVISVAKLKTHGLAYYTGAVKNLFGAIPGLEKAAFHSRYPNKYRFSGVLVDICQLIRPGFSLVDGITGMEGAGPSGGDPKHAGVLGAAVNPYALDLAMCDLVSLPPSLVPVLAEAAERKLVPDQASDLEQIGEDPSAYRTRFLPVPGRQNGGLASVVLNRVLPMSVRERLLHMMTAWPVITEKCIACGKCAEICPRRVIDIKDGRATPDYGGCIRCYCCHEICPVKAIDLVRKPKPAGREDT